MKKRSGKCQGVVAPYRKKKKVPHYSANNCNFENPSSLTKDWDGSVTALLYVLKDP